MPKKVSPGSLVGVAEIAGRLGCSVPTVHSWRRRYEDFPAPLAELSMGMIWDWDEVQKWAEGSGRGQRRP